MNSLFVKLGIGAAIALAIFGAGHHFGARGVQSDWDAVKLAVAQSTNKAITTRVASNAVIEVKQTADNATITKVKNEELAPVRERIVTRRVRVGSALCSGSAAPAEAPRTSGGDGADPASRVVREDLERDLRALEVRVEEALATGRACQAFVTANGLLP
jgi:prophage endopeptidase